MRIVSASFACLKRVGKAEGIERVKRTGKIPWDNYIMRKHGQSICREIAQTQGPFWRIVMAQRLIRRAELAMLDSQGTTQ